MSRLALILPLMALLALPAAAQDDGDNGGNGGTLMEKGARLFLEGILREMEPTLKDLEGMADEIEPAFRDFMREMGPALTGILGRIDDLSNYHAPEMLPNGDIIIRRKTPLAPETAPETAPQEEIEI